MTHALLASAAALAALAVAAGPAQAQGRTSGGVTIHTGGGMLGSGDPRLSRDIRSDRRWDRDRGRGRISETILLGPWGWSDREAGRAWEPDSYNDWWHERPWRSYPRWMANNGDCERQYWAGGGWRC